MPYSTEENLTDLAVERWSNVPDPRLRKIMTSLVKHLHGWVRDIEPTEAEWITAINFLTETGKLCTEKRQEFILLSDTLGVSMLVDSINHRLSSKATPTTVTGPFHIDHSPEIENGKSMSGDAPGIPCFVQGKVTDFDGKPIGNALLDIWQTDGEGLYEAQVEGAEGYMRGIYHSKPDGTYLIQTVAPIGYTIRSTERSVRCSARLRSVRIAPRTSTSCSTRPAITASSPICSRRAISTSTPTWSTA